MNHRKLPSEPYTQFPNRFLDAVIRAGKRFNATQFHLILAVVRKTFGYGKASAQVSVRYLAMATGRHRTNVAREMRALAKMGVLTRAAGNSAYNPSEYAPNLSFGDGEPVADPLHVERPTCSRSATKLLQIGNQTVAGTLTNKRKALKKSLKENPSNVKKPRSQDIPTNGLFEQFWNAYPRKENKFKAQKAWKKAGIDETILAKIFPWIDLAKESEQWQDKNLIPHPSTFLNQRRWEGDPPPKPTSYIERLFAGLKDESDGPSDQAARVLTPGGGK